MKRSRNARATSHSADSSLCRFPLTVNPIPIDTMSSKCPSRRVSSTPCAICASPTATECSGSTPCASTRPTLQKSRSQVRQMLDVYECSSRTVAYLGSAKEEVDELQAAIAHRDYLRAAATSATELLLQEGPNGGIAVVEWDPAAGVVMPAYEPPARLQPWRRRGVPLVQSTHCRQGPFPVSAGASPAEGN